LAGSLGSVRWGGIPLFAICGVVAYLVHWVIFVPSFLYRTEHYFDLTGSITYVSVISAALIGNPDRDTRSMIIGGLIIVWALRLGSFLFRRVKRTGKDGRFDRLKHNFWAFLMTWTLSGLWVLMTAAAALAAMTSQTTQSLGVFAVGGVGIWLFGFLMELIADHQKTRFRLQSGNQAKFIDQGLWAWSRHPNYFGEITLWTGIAIIAFPVLSGLQLATLVSPVFVWLLLTKISGIPMLEAKADANWGNDQHYQDYKSSTPVLFPLPPRRVKSS
jgi:steroid 5-alpha reductase family enzyme